MQTAFTRLVGIDVPIVQAPIGGMAQPPLAAAVSNAGALGMLAITWSEPDQLRAMIEEMHALTDRPFGVNMILEWPQEERVHAALGAGVRFFSFFWGDPTPHLAAIHEAGALAALTVGSAAAAPSRRRGGSGRCRGPRLGGRRPRHRRRGDDAAHPSSRGRR